MVDLHTHSTASDGRLSPRDLVRRAFSEGVDVLALTDHDTVSGLGEAEDEARALGIIFLSGIELNVEWRPRRGEFHLLCLGLERISPELQSLIEESLAKREKRNFEIIEKMRADKIKVSYDEIKALCPSRAVGRPHFAEYLVQKKIASDENQAFDKYLGRGRPWFVRKEGAPLDRAVKAASSCGGVCVVAHPMSLMLSWGKMRETLADFRARGVEGVEAFHPLSREVDCERLERMARAAGLFVTAGSDFHFDGPLRRLGRLRDGAEIDDRFYRDELYPRLRVKRASRIQTRADNTPAVSS